MGFAKQFHLIVRIYKPGYSNLHQLVHLPVLESATKAMEWLQEINWKAPMEDFHNHEAADHRKCRELDHNWYQVILKIFPTCGVGGGA